MPNELTDRHLSDEEAQAVYELLEKLDAEIVAQLNKQGMSNEPISYTTLIRKRYQAYLRQRYGVGDD